MTYLDLWIHLVWSTKYRRPVLTKEIRLALFDHMRQYAQSQGILLDIVNGYTDHIHCLVKMDSSMPVREIARLLKGESSFWLNGLGIFPEHFRWQRGYFAGSVNRRGVHICRAYIRNQEQHHTEKLFSQVLPVIRKKSIYVSPFTRHNGIGHL